MNFSLILLAALVGLAAGTIKQDLIKRLESYELEVGVAIHKYQDHGFTFFAEALNETVARCEFCRKNIQGLPDDVTKDQAQIWISEVDDIGNTLKDKIRSPVLSEMLKAGGLYLASMKEAKNETEKIPTYDTLKAHVTQIVKQENYIKTLGSSAADKPAKEFAEKILKQYFNTLVNDINGQEILTPEDFEKIETHILQMIAQLKVDGKDDSAKKYETGLSELRAMTFTAAKLFPIDSEEKIRLFLEQGPKHYKKYTELKLLLWIDDLPEL